MADRLTVEIPDGWDVRDDVAPFALLARPADRDAWDFVPSLSVQLVDEPAAQEGLDAYVAVQRRALAAELPAHLVIQQILSVDDGTFDLLVAASGPTHETTIQQRHRLLGGTEALIVTATCADTDWPDLVAPLAIAVRSAHRKDTPS